MERETRLQELFKQYPNFSKRFGSKVLERLTTSNKVMDNIVLSPARLQAMLALLANWDSPITLETIFGETMGKTINIDEANRLFDLANIKPLPSGMLGNDGENTRAPSIPILEQHTTLWYQKNLKVKANAEEKIKEAFNIGAKAIDFADSRTKGIIDEYVRKSTHGLIPHLDTEFDDFTLALIVDILYFNGEWEDKFDKYNTTDRVFYGTYGNQEVPTMHRQAYMEYTETPVFQAVSLPYVCESANHKRFAMRIYLPQKGHGLWDVLGSMQSDEFQLNFERCETKLSLPRFEVYNTNVDVKKVLKYLGLSSLLSLIHIMPEFFEGLQVSDISQQVKIKVDEYGTEAAAVTFIEKVGCLPPDEKPKPKEMNVNRPFLFEIVEETTNTVLFMGVVNHIGSLVKTKKTLSKEELIARLKAISTDKSERPEFTGAMCYCPTEAIFEQAKCKRCGAKITYYNYNYFNEREEISETVKDIASLGYDAKVEICCPNCAQQLAKELHLDDKIPYDGDTNRTLRLGEINYLFSFKLKEDDEYHMCIANQPEQYKALMALLKNEPFFAGSYDRRYYIADEKNLLEYMTGIDFDEQD